MIQDMIQEMGRVALRLGSWILHRGFWILQASYGEDM